MGDLTGQSIAGYPLEKLLGKGAYGEVYQATTAAAPLAVKLLRADLRSDGSLNRLVAKGWEDARAVTHANLVCTYSTGVDPQHGAFCLEELVQGKALRKFILEGSKVAWRDCLIVAEQLFSALQALHHAGKCHGDVWPSNVLLTQDQDLKLEGAGGLTQTEHWPTELLPGPAIGYLAPEIIEGWQQSAATDLYSAGACVYFILAGRDLFPGERAEAVARTVLEHKVTPLSAFREDIPPEAEEFITRLTARDPTRRYASAEHVLSDLALLKSGKPLAALIAGKPPAVRRQARQSAERAGPGLRPVESSGGLRATDSGMARHTDSASASKLHSRVDTRSVPVGPNASRVGSGVGPAVKETMTGMKVFGRLDTQVKSTIPQSDVEKKGDDFYRQGQLPLALNCWRDAYENQAPHTGLKVKIELAERDMRREGYTLAIEEARHRLASGDYGGAISRAREALLSVDNDQQRQESLLLESEAIEAQRKAARATTVKFGVAAVLFIIAVFAAFAIFGGSTPPPDETNVGPLPLPAPPVNTPHVQTERIKLPDADASFIRLKDWIVGATTSGLLELKYMPPGAARPAVVMRISKLPGGGTLADKRDQLRDGVGLKNAAKFNESASLVDQQDCWVLGFRYTAADERKFIRYYYLLKSPRNVMYLVEFDGVDELFTNEVQAHMAQIMASWSYRK